MGNETGSESSSRGIATNTRLAPSSSYTFTITIRGAIVVNSSNSRFIWPAAGTVMLNDRGGDADSGGSKSGFLSS